MYSDYIRLQDSFATTWGKFVKTEQEGTVPGQQTEGRFQTGGKTGGHKTGARQGDGSFVF